MLATVSKSVLIGLHAVIASASIEVFLPFYVDFVAESLAIIQKSVQNHALLKMSNAKVAIKWGISPRIVRIANQKLVEIVERKAIVPENVRSLVSKNAEIAMRKDIIHVSVQSLETGPVFNVPIVEKVSHVNAKIDYALADKETEGHGRARCKEPLKEEAQDKNNRPDFIPNTASGVEVGGHDEGSNNKPVTTTDDSNW